MLFRMQNIHVHLCTAEKADGTRCYKRVEEGEEMCKFHRTIAERREQRRREDVVWNDVLDLLWLQGGNTTLTDLTNIVTDAYDRGWITREAFDRLRLDVREQLRMYRILHPEHANATTDLQRLAMDNQNVHTKAVTQMTSDGMKYLLETPVPVGQETLAELETAWSDKDKKKPVLRDMRTWYGMSECVTKSDWLYKRMLDGLWARIKTHKERKELTKRLWEEATESVGKCCQGHLSRLTNVLVGFTEEVKAEVPVGEILQQKMAVIAAKDVDVLHKVCEAWFVCEELKVPQEERNAWIEAF